MMVLPPRTQSRARQGLGIVGDLLIVTAVIWALPVMLGIINALVTFVFPRLSSS